MEILVIAILFSLTAAQEGQLEGPQNTLSVVGSNVTLRCSSPSRNCIGIDWQKYIPGASPMTIFKGPLTIRNVTDRNRYSVDNSSGCDLIIRNVQLTDAGRFICSTAYLIVSTSQITKTAYLIILETQSRCTLVTVSLNGTIEGDGVQLNCAVSYNGTNIVSMNWKGVTDAPGSVKTGKTLSRSHSVVASVPEVPSFTCETSFAYETGDKGASIVGLATNKIPDTTCKTPAIKVLYSPRNVTLTPSHSNYHPGTVITCAANGNPSPTFKWQEMGNSGTWTDIQNQSGSQFTTTDVSSKKYRCVAMNVLRGKNHNVTSREIQFRNTDRLGIGLGIGFGIGFLVAILLATVVIAILVRLRCLYVDPRSAKKSPDGVVHYQNHEMNPSSQQRLDNGRSTTNKGTTLLYATRSLITSQMMELFVIVILLTSAGAQESQLEGPQNTLGVVGSTVTLKCLSPSKNCNGTDWEKYMSGATPISFFKGPRTILNTTETDRDRYSVDNSSGCDLIIKNVKLKDAGRFICSHIISSSQTTKTAYLIILETQPKCTLNVSLDDTAEGDGVQLKCMVTYNGTTNASMVWKGVTDTPVAVKNGNSINRKYSVVASASDVPSFTCEASFSDETDTISGVPIVGVATNIVNANCSTSVINVLYSVRDVTLSPFLSNFPLETVITCVAKGNPSPTFQWQEMENDGLWTDIPNESCNKFTVSDATSKWYRCVAMNVVRGKNYNATSREIQFDSAEFKEKPSASEYYIGIGIGIGVGIGLLVAVLLAAVTVAILVRHRNLEFHPRPTDNSPDGGTHHEMTPSSHQQSAMDRSNPRTEASLHGEQESTYASLGEDRDVNEYASLEKREKSKRKKKSKP